VAIASPAIWFENHARNALGLMNANVPGFAAAY